MLKYFSTLPVANLFSFLRNSSGNIVVAGAFMMLPIMCSVGVAVDFTGINRAKSALQETADGAALAARNLDKLTQDQVEKEALNFLDANYDGPIDDASITLTVTEKVVVVAKANYQTTFMHLFGKKIVPITIISEAVKSETNGGNYELVMVMDMSGSMLSKGKIQSLKTASMDLVKALKDNKGNFSGHLSVVPFARRVNTGRSNWLTSKPKKWTGCTNERTTEALSYNDEPPSAGK